MSEIQLSSKISALPILDKFQLKLLISTTLDLLRHFEQLADISNVIEVIT